VSKHNAAKYTLLEEKRLKNIEELEQNITLTQSTIDKFTKQLFELESLKKQYEEK
jgi:predicted transcriptional regulator